MEKQLQVGLQLSRERTQKLSQLQNNLQMINRVLMKISILHSWGELVISEHSYYVRRLACVWRCGGGGARAWPRKTERRGVGRVFAAVMISVNFVLRVFAMYL